MLMLMLMGMEYFMDELIDTNAKVRNTEWAVLSADVRPRLVAHGLPLLTGRWIQLTNGLL